mmetsp:Transcript_25953/g.83748  ORF Transcript_25953/g.83748 Transcript_25953/m.83748 type:complete len:383 (+) Transcript_25953:273-1421(+)
MTLGQVPGTRGKSTRHSGSRTGRTTTGMGPIVGCRATAPCRPRRSPRSTAACDARSTSCCCLLLRGPPRASRVGPPRSQLPARSPGTADATWRQRQTIAWDMSSFATLRGLGAPPWVVASTTFRGSWAQVTLQCWVGTLTGVVGAIICTPRVRPWLHCPCSRRVAVSLVAEARRSCLDPTLRWHRCLLEQLPLACTTTCCSSWRMRLLALDVCRDAPGLCSVGSALAPGCPSSTPRRLVPVRRAMCCCCIHFWPMPLPRTSRDPSCASLRTSASVGPRTSTSHTSAPSPAPGLLPRRPRPWRGVRRRARWSSRLPMPSCSLGCCGCLLSDPWRRMRTVRCTRVADGAWSEHVSVGNSTSRLVARTCTDVWHDFAKSMCSHVR